MIRRNANNRHSRRAYKNRVTKTHVMNVKASQRGGIRL